MSTKQPSASSPTPDDDLAALLKQVYDSEPLREEFVVSLSERLEAEFDDVSSTLTSDVVQEGAPGSSPDPALPRGRRAWRRVTRSITAVAMAGVIILATVIWTSRPSYSWTSMLQALEAQPWVESVIEEQGEQGTQGWFSQRDQLVVIRKGGDILWNDWEDGLQSRYQSGSGVLLRERLKDESWHSVEDSLLSFLQSGIGGGQLNQKFNSRVLNESWRTVGDGENQHVELDVVLSRGEEEVHLLVTLDPQTHLPLKCQLIEEGAIVESTVRFAYPDQGPQQVYDVGVPRNVVVYDVTSSSEPVRVASTEGGANALVRASESPARPDQNSPELEEQTLPEPPTSQSAETAIAEADTSAILHPELTPPPLVVASSDEMSLRVDDLMVACWDRNGITSAATSSDDEFFRRVYLDLTGRIPTVSEYREFTADTTVDRRRHLVEQLLSRRDHATHMGAVWRKFLLPDGVNLSTLGGSASFEEWLSDRFRDNLPYDELVRQLLLAEGRVSESGPILFYTALNLKPEEIAAQTSRAFLGIRLECAQCHDHFFDNRLKQTDFWGLAAFFAQISQPEGKMDRVSPVLRVADTDHGEVTLPDTEDVISPHFLLEKSLVEDSEVTSRREQLASWITATDNPHFARATVNRVWAHLFGRGLVDPVDDMRIDNPSVCPEVLDQLAGYFVATDFDLRNLFRVIVNSQTYQLTSRSTDGDPSKALHFAQMNIKSFTAEQLYDSISVATRLEPLESEDGSLMRFSNFGRQSFLEQFRAPPGQVTDYQAGIPQALTLMNGGLMQSATNLRSSGILKSLEAPFFTDEQRINTLFLATLSRQPDESEREEMLNYVLAEESGKPQRLSDVLWVLLNSAEFTLNH